MKKLLLLTGLALALVAQPLLAREQPAIDAVRAAKIATDYLTNLGGGAPYIVSLVVDHGAIINGRASWVATWSAPIVNGAETELGVRIRADGTVVRLVQGKGTHSTRPPAALEIR